MNKTESLQVELINRLCGCSRQDVANRAGVHVNTVHRFANSGGTSVEAMAAIERGMIDAEHSRDSKPDSMIKTLAAEHKMTENQIRVKMTKNALRRRNADEEELTESVAITEAVSQLVLARL